MKLLLVLYHCFAERIIDNELVTLGDYLQKMVERHHFYFLHSFEDQFSAA